MKFVMNHNNINVRDLDKSVKFYQEAFGLTIARVHEPEDKSFKLVFLEDENHYWRLELTWLRDHADKPYDLGENESPSGPCDRRLRGGARPAREDGLHLL